MIDRVDPFVGTDVTDLGPPDELSSTWWFPKPQVGNTHPGATSPLGMVSACAYSGAYPTGYGSHLTSTEGIPERLHEKLVASGFTHFQQSGTGAIRKYYNYLRVTPMLDSLDQLGELWSLDDETAEPGYYAATLGTEIRCELTVGPKSAVHRYTFPASGDARVVVDASLGGLTIEHGQTVPLSARLHTIEPGVTQGEVVVEGVPLSFHIECDEPDWRHMLWYDRRLMPGGTRLDFDAIRSTTLRPFGLICVGPTSAGQTIEMRIGFSLRGVEQAKANLDADRGAEGQPMFSLRRSDTETAWRDSLSRIDVDGGTEDRRTIFATALYHSLIKPCFAPDESPFWADKGPFVFDICTMWDIYKTQLPLLSALAPERAVEMTNALLAIAVREGNFPIGYRMARGADRFFRQGSALAHTFLADVCSLGLGGIDWEWALVHLHTDLRRGFGEDFLISGLAHPISHTLDLAQGYDSTARVARRVGDERLAGQLAGHAAQWRNAFDPDTGLLLDSNFYEGGKWNYSFRLLHDMAGRIELAGGEHAFVGLLDKFFGFGAPPVKQLGVRPDADQLAAGYALGRFEGLNNEPDMEAPWAYQFAGRPDRTAEVVRSIIDHQFATGRGGLPGNDDSGGLSSWYVWASLGLFPVAGQNIFCINAPSFATSRINLGNGALLTIEAEGFAEPGTGNPTQYVESVRLDGVQRDRTWLTGNEVHAGGHLSIRLGSDPHAWIAERPPSLTT